MSYSFEQKTLTKQAKKRRYKCTMNVKYKITLHGLTC